MEKHKGSTGVALNAHTAVVQLQAARELLNRVLNDVQGAGG
jgi:hypothetical protein